MVDTAVRWPKVSYWRLAKNCFIALFGLQQYYRDLFILVLMFFKIIHHSGIVGTITGTILSIVAIVQCFRVAGSCS